MSSVQVVSAETNYVYSTQWGSYGSGDGQFKGQSDVAVDGAGNVYVLDGGNRRIQKFTPDGILITQWGPSRKSNIYPFDTEYLICYPAGIAVDSAGNVYVADASGPISMFTSDGTYIKHFWYHSPDWPGPSWPEDVAVDSAGNIFALYHDPYNMPVVELSSENEYITSWNAEGSACHIAMDGAGNVYTTGGLVKKFDSTGTFIKSWAPSGGLVGTGLAVDSAGNVYVAGTDIFNRTGGNIQKFTSTGTPLATFGSSSFGDGQLFQAQAVGVAVDRIGNVYVADPINYRIQKFVPSNVQVTPTATPVPIDVQFASTPTSGTAPLTVQFTDTSAGSITGWQWDFNNDSTVDSTLQNPTFTYTEPGNYSVKLSVTGTGGTKSTVKTNYIAVNGGISVDSVTPDSAVLTVDNVAVSVRGKNFPAGTTFKLVNATLGTITCLPNTVTRVSDTELIGKMSFTDVKAGFYDVLVTTPDGTTKSLDKGFRVLPVPVVLIHGIKSDGTIWLPLEGAFMKEGIPFWNFEYNTWISPTSSATDLAEFIKNQRSTFRKDLYPNGYTGKIDIVCHSMGAIVSRWYMEHNGHGSEVREWIGIAPAHGGSALADYQLDIPRGIALGVAGIGGPALNELSTTSYAVEHLGPISPSTKYHVIAGWNPTHSSDFGYGWFKRTLAKKQLEGSIYEYYYTFSGDMIVATAQSKQPGMGFDAYPIGGILGASEQPHEFDHVHICQSPRVIAAVIGYLNDIKKESSGYEPPEDMALFDYSVGELKLFGLIPGANPLYRVIAISLADKILSPNQKGVNVVESDADSTLITHLEWTDGDLDMTLTSPSGIEYSANSHQNNCWYTKTKESRSLDFIIDSPQSGNWTAKLIPVSYPGHDIAYNLTSYVRELNTSSTIPTPKPTSAPPRALPSQTTVPMDLTGDGLYKDVNGNGALDFNDVVLYFNQMDWISTNEPVSAFDFNKNGQIDFNDVVVLFNEM